MCGIACEIRHSCHTIFDDEKILLRINNRGPNCMNSRHLAVNDKLSIYFCGSVLWMQGSKPTEQPHENDKGILLFNGDLFYQTYDYDSSDTEFVLRKLSYSSSPEYIISEIKMFKGPFSLIYYDKLSCNLFFTRDRIGRNSLLFHKSESSYVISNVLGREYKCVEIPATKIYKYNLIDNKISLYKWEENSIVLPLYSVEEWLEEVQSQQDLPDDEFVLDTCPTLDLEDEDDIIEHIENISTKFIDKLSILKNLLEHPTILQTVKKLTEMLEKSVKVRIETQPNKCKTCIKNVNECSHCTVGILFSGGLDCTILAMLADKYVSKNQPIDLINVAFNTKNKVSYEVPDRITGWKSFEELKKICKSRQWVFHEVNIPRETLELYKLTNIGDLVYPRRTILDESLGSALWFAAGARSDNMVDMSSCRVLLLGSGADELFGGYTRHRNAFKRSGWPGLSKELLLDWKRISFRNLARDNRVICDHGRQPRMPYLDEDFVDYVLGLKPWLKCFPSTQLECGLGDKLILRLMALHIGLNEVVSLPKRALQFGSRIANKKEKGNDVSKTFLGK